MFSLVIIAWTEFYYMCCIVFEAMTRVVKSDEGLMSAFKVLFYMLDIVILPHFFHLKSMLPDNLNKICVRILTLSLAFPISVLLTSSNLTSGRISSYLFEKKGN